MFSHYVQQVQYLMPFWDVPRLWQFCSHWINERILFAIILNEDDTIFEQLSRIFASILTFSCSRLTDLGSQTVQVHHTRLKDDLIQSFSCPKTTRQVLNVRVIDDHGRLEKALVYWEMYYLLFSNSYLLPWCWGTLKRYLRSEMIVKNMNGKRLGLCCCMVLKKQVMCPYAYHHYSWHPAYKARKPLQRQTFFCHLN